MLLSIGQDTLGRISCFVTAKGCQSYVTSNLAISLRRSLTFDAPTNQGLLYSRKLRLEVTVVISCAAWVERHKRVRLLREGGLCMTYQRTLVFYVDEAGEPHVWLASACSVTLYFKRDGTRA